MGSFPNITDFSHELLCQILKYLPLREILSVAMLCRKMSVAVDMHLTLCKSIDFCQDAICGYMPSTITDDHLLTLLKKCPHLETVYGLHPVKTERRRLRKRSALTIPGIIEALSLCFHLKAIETSDLRLLEAIMQHLPHIEIIGHFQNRDGLFPPQASQRLKLQPYPRISSLHLIGVEVPELTAMPHLQHLHLQCVRFTKLQPFRAFLAQNLKSFVMKHCIGPSVPQRYLSLIIALSSSPNLNHLELVRVPLLNGLFQRAVEDSYRHNGFVNLRTLVISGCKGVLEADLGHLMIVSSKNLETLYIQPSLTKDSLFVSLSYAQCSFPKLQNLHLGYIETLNASGEWSNDTLLSFGLAEIPDTPSSITDSGMKVISVLFPRIKTLSVSNCPHLMVMYHWMSPEDDEAWSRLTDLTLQKCHCLQLSSFAVFVAFLANIEVVILNDMFREPPKGCSHVGLSAGTGLGMSSAVVSNQDEHIAVQGHHQDFEHPGDEENEENEREFIDVENEEPHFMVLQRDFFDGEEEQDENGAGAGHNPAVNGQELNEADHNHAEDNQGNNVQPVNKNAREDKTIVISNGEPSTVMKDKTNCDSSSLELQKEKELKSNFKEPSEKSSSSAKLHGQSDTQKDPSSNASLKNINKNMPDNSFKSDDTKVCCCSKSTNCNLYSDYDPHKPSTSKAGRHLDYSTTSNEKSCNKCDFEDDHYRCSKRLKKSSNEQNVLTPKREKADFASGTNYCSPRKVIKNDNGCSKISDSEKKFNSSPDKNLKCVKSCSALDKKLEKGNPECEVSNNNAKNLNSVSEYQRNSNSRTLKPSLKSHHSKNKDSYNNLKENGVNNFTSCDITVTSSCSKICNSNKSFQTDEISESLENRFKSSNKNVKNPSGEINSPKNKNVPKDTICHVSSKKIEDKNSHLTVNLDCEHSIEDGCNKFNLNENVTSAEKNEYNSPHCDIPMNTKANKKTKNSSTEKTNKAQRNKRKEIDESSKMLGEELSKYEESAVTNNEKSDKNSCSFENSCSKHTNRAKDGKKRLAQFRDRFSSSPESISNNTRSSKSKVHDFSQPSTSKNDQSNKNYSEELPRSVRSKKCNDPCSSFISFENSTSEMENSKFNVKDEYNCDSDIEFLSHSKKFKRCRENSYEEDSDSKYFVLKSDNCVEIINSLTGESHKIATCSVNIPKLGDENARVHCLKSNNESNPERSSDMSYNEVYCDHCSPVTCYQGNNHNYSFGSSNLICTQKYSASKKRSKRTHAVENKKIGKHICNFSDNTNKMKKGSSRDCHSMNDNSTNIPSSSKIGIEKLKISNSDASIVINFTEGIDTRVNHLETVQAKRAATVKNSENDCLIKKLKTESDSERSSFSKEYSVVHQKNSDVKDEKISNCSEKCFSPATKKTRKRRILLSHKGAKKKGKNYLSQSETSSKHTRCRVKKAAAIPMICLISQGSQANSADIRRSVRRIRRATARARTSVSSAHVSRSSVHSSKISSKIVSKKPVNLNPRPETHDKATSTSDPLLEDDAVQTLQLTSKTLLSFTVVSCGISDIIIDHCPKLFHIEVQACRILKNLHLNYCPAMKRLNISQCPKLSICALAASIMSTDTNSYFLISYEPCMQGYHPGDGEKAILSRSPLNQSVLLCHDFNNLSHEGIQAIFKEKLLEWFHYLFKMNKSLKSKSRNMKKKSETPDSSEYPYHHDLRKMYGCYAYSSSNDFCQSEGQYQLVTNNPVFCDIYETHQLDSGFPSIYDCDAVKNISLISYEAREISFKMENNFIGFYIPITENNQTNF